MTAQLLSALAWICLVLFPVTSSLLIQIADYLLSFLPVITPVRYAILALLGYFVTYLIVKHFMVEDFREATGSPDANPDRIAPFALIATIITFVVFISVLVASSTESLWTSSMFGFLMPAILALLLVNIGIAGGAGKRELPEDREDSPHLPPADGLDKSAISVSTASTKEYTWSYNTEPFVKSGKALNPSISLSIPGDTYNGSLELSSEMHAGTVESIIECTQNSISQPSVTAVSAQLREISNKHSLKMYSELHLVLTFCSSLEYEERETDASETLSVKYPVTTLADGKGNKIDIAILCGALLTRLGYSAYLAVLEDHVYIGVEIASEEHVPFDVLPYCNGVRMFVCELAVESHGGEELQLEFWYNSSPTSGVAPSSLQKIDAMQADDRTEAAE